METEPWASVILHRNYRQHTQRERETNTNRQLHRDRHWLTFFPNGKHSPPLKSKYIVKLCNHFLKRVFQCKYKSQGNSFWDDRKIQSDSSRSINMRMHLWLTQLQRQRNDMAWVMNSKGGMCGAPDILHLKQKWLSSKWFSLFQWITQVNKSVVFFPLVQPIKTGLMITKSLHYYFRFWSVSIRTDHH